MSANHAPLLNESARPTTRHYTILAMAWAGWMFDFYDLMLFSFLLVPIKKALALSDAQLSLLLGVSLASTAVGGLVFGWLADRFGRKHVLSATILTYSLGTFLCGISTSREAALGNLDALHTDMRMCITDTYNEVGEVMLTHRAEEGEHGPN